MEPKLSKFLAGFRKKPYRFLLMFFFFLLKPLHFATLMILALCMYSSDKIVDIQNQPPEVFFVKRCFFINSQNSQENTCARVPFLIKLQASGLMPATISKKRLWHRCFPVNFAKFLRISFLQNTSGRLLLDIVISRLRHNFTIIAEWFYEDDMVLIVYKCNFLTVSFNEQFPDFSFNDTLFCL